MLVIWLVEQHKRQQSGKIRQIFTHLSLHMHEPDVKSHNGTIKALGHVGHVREEFQMRHGKIVR